MLLSDSLVRPWPNPLSLAPRQRPSRESFFLFSRSESAASTSSTTQPPPWKLIRRGGANGRLSEFGCDAYAHSLRYRNEPGVEAEDAREDDEQEGEQREEDAEAPGFVEIGYIRSVHGLQGEVRVKSSTAFPELRFGEPGIRWLRARVSGTEELRTVELTSGRSHSVQDSWVVSFNGINTVEEARQLIGSTILIKEDDRPELEEGEFYTPDLYGMKVILKETGEEVGTVVNVVNQGSNDLLQVRISELNASHVSKGSASRLVWVPFVEAIVPDVNIHSREMLITPPKGLLELNARSDSRSKKERRLMEWKERQKLLQNVSLAKKKLAEMGQEHILRGLIDGVKDKKKLLRRQIGNINLRLFKHALGNISTHVERNKHSLFLDVSSSALAKKSWEISSSCYNLSGYEEKEDLRELRADGLHLISEGKLAIVLISDGQKNESGFVFQLKSALSAYSGFAEANQCGSSPLLIILSPIQDLKPCQELLGSDEFGIDDERVWLLEEVKLPVVNTVESDCKILMRSSWEIIESPAGSGAIFSTLSSYNILSKLNEMGVQYVQVCSPSQTCALGSPIFLGLVNTQKASAGIKILNDEDKDSEIDMIFSTAYLNKAAERMDEQPRFYAAPEQNRHVELVDNEWVDVEPSEANSYRLYCPVDDLLRSCSADDAVLLKITQ